MLSGLPQRADRSLSWVNWLEGRSASVGKALGIGTGQRMLMEQLRPFDADVAKAAGCVSVRFPEG